MARSRRRRADPVTTARLHVSARARALALAAVMLAALALAARAEAAPRGFWGVVPQATPNEEQLATARTGRRGIPPHPVRMGRAATRTRRPDRLGGHRPGRRRRHARGHHRAARSQRCPELGRAGRPRARRRRQHGARPPAGARLRCPQLASLPQAGGRALRARGQLLVDPPRSAGTADPDLADLERAELQVLRRATEPDRIRAARPRLLLGAEVGGPGRAGGPRAASSPSRTVPATPAAGTRASTGSPATSSPGCTGRRRGSGPEFNGVALHPYTGNFHHLVPEIEEVRQVPARIPRPAQGAVDHRARLELPAPRARQLLRQGPGRPGAAAHRRLPPAEEQAADVEPARRLLVLGRRPAGVLQLLRRHRPVRGRLRAQALLVCLRRFAGGTP